MDVDRSRKASNGERERQRERERVLFEQLYFHESLCTRTNVSTNELASVLETYPGEEAESIERRFKETR